MKKIASLFIILFFTNTLSFSQVTIDSCENIGLGEDNPSYKVHINLGDTNKLYIDMLADGVVGGSKDDFSIMLDRYTFLADTTHSIYVEIPVIYPEHDAGLSFGKSATNDFHEVWVKYLHYMVLDEYSDKNIKENIRNIDNPAEKISALVPVKFDFKEDFYYNKQLYKLNNKNVLEESRTDNFGFIAQDFEKVFPELTVNKNNLYLINMIELIPVLTETIKQQNKIINENKEILETYEKRINNIDKAIKKIQKEAKVDK